MTPIHTLPARPVARAVAAIGLLVASLALSACNTTAGAGQDVSAVGRATTNAAERVRTGL